MKPRTRATITKNSLLTSELDRFKDEKNATAFNFSKDFLTVFNRQDIDFITQNGAPPEFISAFRKVGKPGPPTGPRPFVPQKTSFSKTPTAEGDRVASAPAPLVLDEKKAQPGSVASLLTGVEKLGEPSIPPQGNERHFFKGKIMGNRLYVGDKPSGMEPGSIAVQINTDLIHLLRENGIVDGEQALNVTLTAYKSDQEREAAYIDFLSKSTAELHKYLDKKQLMIVRQEKKLPSLLKMVLPDQSLPRETEEKLSRLEEIVADLREDGMKGKKRLSLLKQMYTDRSISPPIDRLRKTARGKNMSNFTLKRWKNAKELASSRQEENANAIGETFGNAIAGAYAMPAQKQYMLISSYLDGSLKIITDCEWQPGLQSMEGQVAGKKYQGYFVEVEKVATSDGQVLLPKKNLTGPPYYRSSLDQLSFAAQNLSLLLIQADDDCFGSKLQNKMVLGKELYGIDFGHAYRTYNKKNLLVKNLSVDFTLRNKTQKKYKNLSILFDSPPTDQMLGVFYTFKSMSLEALKDLYTPAEIQNINTAIENYKNYYNQKGYSEFARKIDTIQPGAIEKIYSAYEKEFNKLIANEKKPERIAELKENLETLRLKASYHQKNSIMMLEKFKSRLQMDPENITLLRNLAKLTSETRDTDLEGTVALNHLQILDNKKRIEWDLKPGKDEKIINLIAKIPAGTSHQAIADILLSYAKATGLEELQAQHIIINNDQLIIEVSQEKLLTFAKFFAESTIKKIKPSLAADLHIVPDLIKINKNIPGSAELVRNLSILTSLTSTAATGEIYILEGKKTETHWHIKQNNNNTVTLSAKVPKEIGARNLLIMLNTMSNKAGLPTAFSQSGDTIKITGNYAQIENLLPIFSEDNIKKIKQDPQETTLRQLSLHTKKFDEIMAEVPAAKKLFTNLITLATLTVKDPTISYTFEKTTADKNEETEKYIIKLNIPQAQKEDLVERLRALSIGIDTDYNLIENVPGVLIIECESPEKLNKLISSVNNHSIFNLDKLKTRSVNKRAPVNSLAATVQSVLNTKLPAVFSSQAPQSTSSIANQLGLSLQQNQNSLPEGMDKKHTSAVATIGTPVAPSPSPIPSSPGLQLLKPPPPKTPRPK